jgi:hypothetical protein
MAPYTKLIALCFFGASLAAASLVPADMLARSPEANAKKLDILTTPQGDKFALVPVDGDGTISVNKMLHTGEKHGKRDEADTDSVAYNPAYQYSYSTLYMYVANYGYAN